MKCTTLSATGGADGPVEKKTGRKIPIEPFKGTDDAVVHSKRPKSPVGDVRGDSVEALLDVSTGSAYLGLLGALRGEVCIFDFERKKAEDLGTVSSWDAPNKGGRKPSKHPFVRLAHTELSPGAINKGGDRDRPLLDGVSTAFTLGGKGDPNLGDGPSPRRR